MTVTKQSMWMLGMCLLICCIAVDGNTLRFMPHNQHHNVQGAQAVLAARPVGPPPVPPHTNATNPGTTFNNLRKVHKAGQPVAFASYFGNHMVLQKAPKSAGLWGSANTSLIGQVVLVSMVTSTGEIVQKVTSKVQEKSPTHATWSVQLKPTPAGGPYNITVQVKQEKITLMDVLFGDVWLCSGQSNMQFSVSMLNEEDLQKELEYVSLYSQVRLFTVLQTQASVPQEDLIKVEQPWSITTAKSLSGGNWTYFSAVCWLYGRRLYESLGYPIGLVASDYGGTPVKAWSSPDALKKCTQEEIKNEVVREVVGGPPYGESFVMNNSVLWNAMIHPLLNMTIHGVIWYQGEADKSSNNYNCTFPAMIADWRQKFHMGSLGQTDALFPFGFVQLAPNQNDSSIVAGFPSLRWQQTVNKGYVPNADMPNVFMAVAMDLPDFTSPFGSIHPRDKETVADRLHLSAMSVAYGTQGLLFQGPLPYLFVIYILPVQKVQVIYRQGTQEETQIRVLNNKGFEVCCSEENNSTCSDLSPSWAEVPVIGHDKVSVMLSAAVCKQSMVMGLRYAWRESPCPYKRCAIYSAENFLPGPSFVHYFGPDDYAKDSVTSIWFSP